MKKLLFLSITFCTLLLASCTKKDMQSKIIEDDLAVTEVLKQANYQIQKSMYKSLTASEKALAWNRKYEMLLLETKMSKEQSQFIKGLISIISPDVFTKVENPVKTAVMSKGDKIKNEAVQLFGVDKTAELLGTLTVNNYYPPGQGDCDCSKSSDFCPSGHACLRDGCTIQPDDCGLWWSYDCNGDCWIDV